MELSTIYLSLTHTTTQKHNTMNKLRNTSDLTEKEKFNPSNKEVSFIKHQYCVSVGVIIDENDNEVLIRDIQGWRVNKINKNRILKPGLHNKYYSPNALQSKTVFEVLNIEPIEIDWRGEEW